MSDDDCEEFADRARQVVRQQQLLTDIIEEATVINKTQLTDGDFTRLLYGRLNVPLSDIEEVLSELDNLDSMSPKEAATRLIAQKTQLAMQDVELVLDDASQIHRRYGDGDND